MKGTDGKVVPQPRTPKIPPGSFRHWPVIFSRMEPPSHPQGPNLLYCIPLGDADLPLGLKKGESEKDRAPTRYRVGGCSSSTILGMYNPPSNLISGAVYITDGVTFSEYHSPDGQYPEPIRSIRITDLELSKESAAQHLAKIPFEKKCIKSNMYYEGEGFDQKKFYLFFAAEIDYNYPLEKKTLAGAFTVAPKLESKHYEYEGKNAYTGDKQQAQVVLNQTDEDGVSKSFMIYTSLYDDSIEKLQLRNDQWKTLGYYLMHFQKGLLLCTTKEEATKNKIDPSIEHKFVAALNVYSKFIPDLPAMIKGAGFEINWETAVKIAPSLGPRGENLKVEPTETPLVDIRKQLAVNLLRINGDITAMLDYPQWVKFYLIFDYRVRMDKDNKKIPPPVFKTVQESCEWVLNPDNWKEGFMTFEIFAVCTPECKETIDTFVCEPGKSALIRATDPSNKRQKVEATSTTTVEPVAAPVVAEAAPVEEPKKDGEDAVA